MNLYDWSNALPNGEYVNLVRSTILPWSDGNISSPARNSFWSVWPDENADICAAPLLI